MNIGERFYCSSCLAELSDEMICPVCGYDPAGAADPDVLKEGTLLKGIQYQVGAVNRRTRNYIVYGAFDYLRLRMVFVWEYFPLDLVMRAPSGNGRVTVLNDALADFETGKRRFICSTVGYGEWFRENNTVYLVFLPV